MKSENDDVRNLISIWAMAIAIAIAYGTIKGSQCIAGERL